MQLQRQQLLSLFLVDPLAFISFDYVVKCLVASPGD